MIDYRGIKALAKIVEMGSFERAAEHLRVSQSAISQRLKNLQNYYGDPLLIRDPIYSLTSLGEILIGHYRKVQSLERDLGHTINNTVELSEISISISRDSLETWFSNIIYSSSIFNEYKIEIISEDQDFTIEYLRKGIASICFTTLKDPIANCKSEFLGYMRYVLVASEGFKEKYFASDICEKSLLTAPALAYDKQDDLHIRYLGKFFHIENAKPLLHTIPSVRGFKEMVCRGFAYALIPELDVQRELRAGKLVNLFPDKVWHMPVFMHSWQFGQKKYNNIVKLISEKAKLILADTRAALFSPLLDGGSNKIF
ncbi:MAG: ArgP/LysG family DNA-binding transcriptional regulator [Pseudomonadota bacterium]